MHENYGERNIDITEEDIHGASKEMFKSYVKLLNNLKKLTINLNVWVAPDLKLLNI